MVQDNTLPRNNHVMNHSWDRNDEYEKTSQEIASFDIFGIDILPENCCGSIQLGGISNERVPTFGCSFD